MTVGVARDGVRLFSDAEQVVELAVGDQTDFAVGLSNRNISILTTDIRDCSVPEEIRFVRDDLRDPCERLYRSADALYARRLPEELQRPAVELADSVEVPLYFTTLGFEYPVVPVDLHQCGTTTWYRAT